MQDIVIQAGPEGASSYTTSECCAYAWIVEFQLACTVGMLIRYGGIDARDIRFVFWRVPCSVETYNQAPKVRHLRTRGRIGGHFSCSLSSKSKHSGRSNDAVNSSERTFPVK